MPNPTLSRRRARGVYAQYRKFSGKRAEPPDAIVIANGSESTIDPSFFYLTGIRSGMFEGARAIVKPSGLVHVITSELEAESARQATTGIRVHIPKSRKQGRSLFRRLVGAGRRTVGINEPYITAADARSLRRTLAGCSFQDASEALLRARLVKDRAELAAIRRACKISAHVGSTIHEFARTNTTENAVAAQIDHRQQLAGAQGPSFATISAFGRHAAEPHYTSGSARLRGNVFALFDYGTKVDRYCSDITRTFFHGTTRRRDRRMYETVREAQDAAFAEIRPGAVGKDVDAAARDRIDSTEFKGTFIHGLGHGLGLAVHDGGAFAPKSNLVLEPGMVMTVEPGVYLPGYGGVRIEDDIVVTQRGYRRLTNVTRDLVSLG